MRFCHLRLCTELITGRLPDSESQLHIHLCSIIEVLRKWALTIIRGGLWLIFTATISHVHFFIQLEKSKDINVSQLVKWSQRGVC